MQKTEKEYLIAEVKKWVIPRTFNHCIGVMNVMADLSGIYHLDKDKAIQAGLLHDIGKNLSIEDQLKYARIGSLHFNHDIELTMPYIHGQVSAYLAKTVTKIIDESVLEAISTHTTYDVVSEVNHNLTWCLRIADVLAPEKNWIGMKKLKRFAYAGKFDEAKLLVTYWLSEYIPEKGIPLHPNYIAQLNYLKSKVKPGKDFFNREK